MNIRTNRSVYSRPAIRNSAKNNKDNYMHVIILSNELDRLEYEKKIAEMKVKEIERRIGDVQEEIGVMNALIDESIYQIENHVMPPEPRKKHVTFEY